MPFRECLSEHLLDVNFVKLIRPIYWMQLILGSNCVVISGNLVSAITCYQRIYTIVCIIVVTVSLYWFELAYYNNYYGKEKTLYYTFSFGLFVQYASYLFNVIHARFMKSEQTVRVFLKLQMIDSALKKSNMASLCVVNYYINVIWIGYIITNFGIGFAIYVFYTIEQPLYTIPIGCAILSVYIELVLTGSCIYYLSLRLRSLNNVIRSNILYRKHMKGSIQNIGLDNIVTFTHEHTNIKNFIKLKDFTSILTSILKSFHCISDLFMFQLFNVVVTVFIWTFLVIESTVVGLRSKSPSDISYRSGHGAQKYLNMHSNAMTKEVYSDVCEHPGRSDRFMATVDGNEKRNLEIIVCLIIHILLIPTLASVVLMSWIIFYFILIASVAYTCDWFAKQVHDTKSLVLGALSVYSEDKEVNVRKSAWDLLQLIEFEKPVFSVYGIFILNMRLPLKLISVITTNVLVLIQYTSNALNTN